jgi:hypothetical protein
VRRANCALDPLPPPSSPLHSTKGQCMSDAATLFESAQLFVREAVGSGEAAALSAPHTALRFYGLFKQVRSAPAVRSTAPRALCRPSSGSGGGFWRTLGDSDRACILAARTVCHAFSEVRESPA